MNARVKALPKEKQKFLGAVILAAQASRHETGIPASVVAAQCLLESGWGLSKLATQGKNYFGVKADRDWKGPIVLMPTKEYMGGKWIVVNAKFRKYASLEESIKDHAVFLKSNPRYMPCFSHKNDYKEFARTLKLAGYATDPNYTKLIVDIIESYGLQHYDFPV